jgi:hypothetical protein
MSIFDFFLLILVKALLILRGMPFFYRKSWPQTQSIFIASCNVRYESYINGLMNEKLGALNDLDFVNAEMLTHCTKIVVLLLLR